MKNPALSKTVRDFDRKGLPTAACYTEQALTLEIQRLREENAILRAEMAEMLDSLEELL